MSEIETTPAADAGTAAPAGPAENGQTPDNAAATQTMAVENPGQGTTAPPTPSGESFFDPKQVPPQLQGAYKQMQAAFTRSMQGNADVRKRAAAFEQLVHDQEFQRWYIDRSHGGERRQEPASQNPIGLTDEKFQSILSDKEQFASFLHDAISRAAQQLVAPRLQEQDREVKTMKRSQEIESFSQANPDFWDLDSKGLIEPILLKYPSISIDDAYKIAKAPFIKGEALEQAQRIVAEKRSAATEKPGAPSTAAKGPVKVKNRSEAMAMAFEAAKAGREVPEFEIGG